MAYLGRGLSTGQYRKLDSIASSFDGDTTEFELTIDNTTITPSSQNCLISINGVEEGSGVTRDMQINSSQWKLGSYGSNGFNGYMDEFRILRGEAAFTGNFTPPTAPYELF